MTTTAPSGPGGNTTWRAFGSFGFCGSTTTVTPDFFANASAAGVGTPDLGGKLSTRELGERIAGGMTNDEIRMTNQ